MKNIFGEEVKPRVLSFEWYHPRLAVMVDGKWAGIVQPNGWNGYSNIHSKVGEPVIATLTLDCISFKELQVIMAEYNKHISETETMDVVIKAVAQNKNISFSEASQLVKAHNLQY